MQLHTLTRTNSNKKSRAIGRGGKRGKTSGKGHKGQGARAGAKIRPEIRDFIKKIPKLRGRGANIFRSIQTKPEVVNVANLEGAFKAGETVTPTALLEKRLVRRQNGKTPTVKILGNGDLTLKLIVSECIVSAQAKEKIEKAGGEVKTS